MPGQPEVQPLTLPGIKPYLQDPETYREYLFGHKPPFVFKDETSDDAKDLLEALQDEINGVPSRLEYAYALQNHPNSRIDFLINYEAKRKTGSLRPANDEDQAKRIAAEAKRR